MMQEVTSFAAFAGELAGLRRRQKELGFAALAQIRRSDKELAELLQDAFGLDDEKAAEWLAQAGFAAHTSPIELLATGRRNGVRSMLVSISRGLCA